MNEIKNKYLVFTIEKEQFAISLPLVQEVISYQPIYPLYDVSSYLKGVINLRGKIIPVLDLRLKFGLPEVAYTERTIFIIINLESENQSSLLGLVVDSVKDVITLDESEIQQPHEIGFKFKSKYIHGIAQYHDDVVIILDIQKILTTEEIIELHEQIKE
ncbi:MAG: chemotaxis protein CheW [Leptospiraceae bacterium]|nr:chemotaxis protein CheW [Leptospiraceae bacterium]MDW7975220.1 chemotaxis protein CheW [Leptospiraceae bacterium]